MRYYGTVRSDIRGRTAVAPPPQECATDEEACRVVPRVAAATARHEGVDGDLEVNVFRKDTPHDRFVARIPIK